MSWLVTTLSSGGMREVCFACSLLLVGQGKAAAVASVLKKNAAASLATRTGAGEEARVVGVRQPRELLRRVKSTH